MTALERAAVATAAASEIFERVDQALLFFSGGKESVVLADLVEPWRERVTLFWLNTGDGPPGMTEFVRDYGSRFRLVEVSSDPRASWGRFGAPADVVAVGSAQSRATLPRVQPWSMCCWRNRNVPLQRKIAEVATAMIQAGLKVVALDGQRDDDLAYTQEEARAEFPFSLEWLLWDWNEADVMARVADRGLALPTHYAEIMGSTDCLSCPADMKPDRMAYLDRHFPKIAGEVRAQVLFAAQVASQQIDKARLSVVPSP